jgi:hypothetical protein
MRINLNSIVISENVILYFNNSGTKNAYFDKYEWKINKTYL